MPSGWIKCARTSLTIAFFVALIEAVVGITAGVLWGYVRGLDFVFTELYNIFDNIPTAIVLILISYVATPSIWTMVLGMAIKGWIEMARFIRNQILIIRDRDYNVASRCIGTPTIRIVLRNLLPYLVSVIMLRMALTIPEAIGNEVFITYIGLGLSVETPSLGNLINDGRKVMMQAGLRYQLLYPTIILSFVTIAFYLIGNAFSDAADPTQSHAEAVGLAVGAGLFHGAALGDGVVGGQFVHERGLDAAVEQVFHGQRRGFIEAQFKGIPLFLLLLLDGVGFGSAALHAQLDLLAQDVFRRQLGIGGHQKNTRNGPVGIGELHHLGAFRRDAHAGADHVDLFCQQGRNNAVPGHGFMGDFHAHGLGDPVQGIHVKTGGLAGLFIHVGKGRVVGVNAVYVALFGKGGHGGQQRSQQCADKKFFHAHFPPSKEDRTTDCGLERVCVGRTPAKQEFFVTEARA